MLDVCQFLGCDTKQLLGLLVKGSDPALAVRVHNAKRQQEPVRRVPSKVQVYII